MSFDVRISHRLGDRHIETEFQSPPGLTALFGPSGAGKTSVLNMVAGLLEPNEGHIALDTIPLFDRAQSLNVAPEHRRAGYVFQDGRLFPHRRVRDNLLYGYALAEPEHRWMTLNEAVALLGIETLLERWPSTLSGGEKQRVAIGRALLSGPRFLLMDEPLSSLDRPRREEVMRVIERIRDELKLPILYVSHDAAEVERLADTVVRLD